MNKDEILKKISGIYNENRKENEKRNIKFPKRIEISESNRKITLVLGKDSICKNMQTDEAAFEGWILCIRRWLSDGEKYNILLDWETPSEVCNEHYQRFLYRVKNFWNLFRGWFELNNEKKLDDSKIKEDGEKYLINTESIERHSKSSNKPLDELSETELENKIVGDENISGRLKNLLNLKNLCRQLPVGLFKGKVEDKIDSIIFPSKKSCIDIWGIDNNNCLVIFELKKKKNIKVGAISELFFYSMMMLDVQKGKFGYENKLETLGKMGEIQTTKGINAYIIAPDFHPLIDSRVLDILNSALKKENVKFGLIKINDNFAFEEVKS